MKVFGQVTVEPNRFTFPAVPERQIAGSVSWRPRSEAPAAIVGATVSGVTSDKEKSGSAESAKKSSSNHNSHNTIAEDGDDASTSKSRLQNNAQGADIIPGRANELLSRQGGQSQQYTTTTPSSRQPPRSSGGQSDRTGNLLSKITGGLLTSKAPSHPTSATTSAVKGHRDTDRSVPNGDQPGSTLPQRQQPQLLSGHSKSLSPPPPSPSGEGGGGGGGAASTTILDDSKRTFTGERGRDMGPSTSGVPILVPPAGAGEGTGRSSTSPTREDPVMSTLLGPGAGIWRYSDAALAEALRLRAEQEKTKQEFYRVEAKKRAIELMNMAMRYQVPPAQVAALFGDTNEGAAAQQRQMPQPPPPPPSQVAAPGVPPPPPPGAQLQGGIALAGDRERYPPTASAPGAGQQHQPHHHHQRNLSLPPIPASQGSMSPSYRTTAPVLSSAQYASPQRRPWTSQPQPQHETASTTSGQGGQYYPPPAQPSSPSSSLHHIIQFHHWQPNQPKQGSAAASPRKSEGGDGDSDVQLKRRRSTTEGSGGSSTTAPGSPTPRSAAISAATAHTAMRKRGMGHSRHRSEASVLRGGSWSVHSPAAPTTSSQTMAAPRESSEQFGVNVLANLAVAERDRQQSAQLSGQTGARSSTALAEHESQQQSSGPQQQPAQGPPPPPPPRRKHDVSMMISSDTDK